MGWSSFSCVGTAIGTLGATGALRCACTCLRPGEAHMLHRPDVDFEAARLVIRAERMKMPGPHVVPMSDQVPGLLKDFSAADRAGLLRAVRSAYQNRPISDNTVNAALRRLGLTKGEMLARGFRKIASTLLGESGFNRDWIERQLAHVESNKVRAAYDKSAHIEGRTEMMQACADMLDKLVDARPVSL